MGDINEYVGSKNLKLFFDHLDMREIIREQHGMDGSATTRSNKSRQAIDGIWGALGIQIIAGGCLPFHLSIRSDHRLIWVKFKLRYVLGIPEPPMRQPSARSLRMDDAIAQR
eukprot:2869464-Ditylum_brightwellii.AAC.1